MPFLAFLTLVIIAFFFLFVYLIPVRLWIAAIAAGVRIGVLNLVGMRLRKVDPHVIINSMIMLHKAGLTIITDGLEAHYLAGGDVIRVVKALISADKANLNLKFERACAIDLAGRDVLDAVKTSVNPRVIDAPKEGVLAAVAKDGIELKARARVTVRANLERLVGGATEETIIARVGEGIVTTIGSAETYKKVLENPDMISKNVLSKGLDAGTAFEILSIDIADVDVGKNVGAALQASQAEADLKVAQARAETRRAMAVALEQEMKAKAQEMRAKVIEAEVEIPLAMAYAFREGKLGVMDYYNLRNIQADTTMRERIGKPSEEKKK
ncbi:MAG: flotillin-like protein FloA [Candidatus Omnitrophica bacterium]|nr:flotillin-like protein FloA [Candidatus Omnitrophota bacterium]MBU1871330.1 flotillin-like protein FloA [Candidatus Omnitrophota bacterium]